MNTAVGPTVPSSFLPPIPSLISGVMSGINQPPPPADLLKSIVGVPQAFIARVHHRHRKERGGTVYTDGKKKECKSARLGKLPLVSFPPSCSLPLSIFLQVLNFAEVRFIPVRRSPILGIGGECGTNKRRGGAS